MSAGADSEDDDTLVDLQLMEATAVVRVGGCLTRFTVEFSLDNKLYFICLAKSVLMYSVKTGERVGILSGHTATVVGTHQNPANKLQLYSGSHDGTIRLWDFYEEQCLKIFSLGTPILHFVLTGNTIVANVNELYKTAKIKGVKSDRCVSYDLKNQELKELFSSKICAGLVASQDGLFVASIAAHTLSVINTTKWERTKLVHSEDLTCVAFHPKDPYLATGDSKGSITLWYRYDNPAKLVTTKMHWHAHPVSCLAFSTDGGYLLSGGEEAVLVVWQIETGHKHFLPRLGSTIDFISISPDANLYALSCADNTIKFVNAVSSTVERVCHGLRHSHMHKLAKSDKALQTGLIIEPRHQLLVLNGMPGELQFYDPTADRHVMIHQVIERNTVSRTDEVNISPSNVQRVAFSREGEWMATVDRRVNCETSDVCNLKFWSFDSASSSYTFNTIVNAPHKEKIMAIKFHPSRNILVSVSTDGTFKLWQEFQKKDSVGVATPIITPFKSSWRCIAVRTFRGFKPIACAFSADGSLLAVSFGQVITLWDPSTASLLRTLLHPPPSHNVRWLDFLPCSPFLAAATPQALYVWNVLTASMWWSTAMPVAGLAVDAASAHLVVVVRAKDPSETEGPITKEEEPIPQFASKSAMKKYYAKKKQKLQQLKEERNQQHSKTHLVMFRADSPVPLRMWRVHDIRLELEGGYFTSALTFLQPPADKKGGPGGRSLLFLTRHKQLARIDGVFGAPAAAPKAAAAANNNNNNNNALSAIGSSAGAISLFDQLYGSAKKPQQPAPGVLRPKHVEADTAKAGTLSGFLAGPVHLMPQLARLYDPLMALCLRPAVQGGSPQEAGAGQGDGGPPPADSTHQSPVHCTDAELLVEPVEDYMALFAH